ncbi:Cell wall-active antibiotics response 4TMS YvqF [Actinoplanes cyaneus]|nr:Cell wall-active antibiotics response 4TMS YvqF [Actinoplanes cyaneus]
MPAPVNDGDRERVAELLQRACGEGRLTLEEFSVRVGAVWAAETDAELAHAADGLPAQPIVGSSNTVDKILTVFSQTTRRGRWRVRDRTVRANTVFGATELDLRAVLTSSDVIEITGRTFFGELKVIVPEGVEVDLSGLSAFSSREMKLAPVPRVPGTPEVRIHVTAWFASVEVISRPPEITR